MKRPNKLGDAEMLGRLEDRAVDYLGKLSAADAFATGLEAEVFLATKWAAEQAEMLRCGDTRKVFRIVDDDFQRMRQARDMIPPGGRVHLEALHCILRTVDDLHPNQKWRVASAIAFRACARCLLPNGLLPGSGALASADL